MVEVRACVYFFVLFLSFHVTVGKPFFGFGYEIYCDLFCEDDDPATTTTSTSTEDYNDEIWCGGCGPRKPRTTTTIAPTTLVPPAVTANPGVPPFNVVIPASATATNVTLWRPNANSGWFMNMMPWNMGAPPAGPPGPPPPTAAPLVATTVAAAAAAGATPAAGSVAATTAAPAA